ncbi:hypothetical protein AAVH_13919 [Aphelenchoides avenae]|nr:hypothetical protein AAVH_13919 [Aphelenchus avenae]
MSSARRMLPGILVVVLSVAGIVRACPPENSNGPCLDGTCSQYGDLCVEGLCCAITKRTGECVDRAKNCDSMALLCYHQPYLLFMDAYCPKTCGLC